MPLLLAEMMRILMENENADCRDGLKGLIMSRLEGMSESERALILTLSAFGGGAQPEELAAGAGRRARSYGKDARRAAPEKNDTRDRRRRTRGDRLPPRKRARMPLRLNAGLPKKAAARKNSLRPRRRLVASRMEPGAQRQALPPLHRGGQKIQVLRAERLRNALPHQPEPHTIPDDRRRSAAPLLRAVQQPRGDGREIRTDAPDDRRAARLGAGERKGADGARSLVLRTLRRLSHKLGRLRQGA